MKSLFGAARTIVGIVLIVVSIAGIYTWEMYGRKAFTYEDILVFKDNIEEGTVVTEEMLGYVKVSRDSIIKDAIVNPKKVVGQTTTTYLPALTQLVPEYFEDTEVALKYDEYVLSIPSSWLVAHPQTLRRHDTAHFYAVKEDSAQNIKYDKDGNPVLNEKLKSTGVIVKARVAYAKDGSNQEINSADSDRLNGTGNVSLIEIVCDMDEADTLTRYIEAGYKFVVLYN